MSVTVLQHAVAQHTMLRLRDRTLSPEDFRREMHRLSLILAVEATDRLALSSSSVETPIATASGYRLLFRQALVPITRAGNGLLDAFQQFLPDALVWHVSVSRNEETAEPQFHGSKVPKMVPNDINVCFVLDPMLATGGSACLTIQLLKDAGATSIVYVGVLGAPEGVKRLRDEHPDVLIILIAIDEKLNEKKYIVPGLGDAGDRQYPTE